MSKKLPFILLYWALHVTFSTSMAANVPTNDELQCLKTAICDAPPPDSFRVTGVGSTFITLAWQPAWVDATHTLAVLEKNVSGVWAPLNTLDEVPGTSYTVSNLNPGSEYRFIIATNCALGEPSIFKVKRDWITLIIELTIGGRSPLNPVAVGCHNIAYKSHNWVGFKVEHTTKEGVQTSSLFEFVPYDDGNTGGDIISSGSIARVDYGNPIVATDEEGYWPNNNNNNLPAKNPFRMALINENGFSSTTIGRVGLTGYLNSIDLCADYQNADDPWDNKYTFTALTAGTSFGIQPPKSDDRLENQLISIDKVWVQSPFQGVLNVFIPQHGSDDGKVNLQLHNANGKIVLEESFDIPSTRIALNVGTLPSGIYILRIESKGNIQSFKTLKLE